MDPNAALEKVRELCAEILDHGNCSDDEATDLAEAARGLDQWMSMGGFPPIAWTPKGVFRIPCTNTAFKKEG